MARRLQKTAADYVVIAISPALIMTLVGSLVFFLLAVFYQGHFHLRLHWVMACFVFGAVLVSRIAIEEGFERAAPFGAALAVAVGVAANRFMEFQGESIESFSWLINWSLIALIWWCAHKLTWDCTVIDDSQDASGQGLLQVAGLERTASDSEKPEENNVEGTTSRHVSAGWWNRYVEGQRRAHAPGVWVVYFSLAALPLFGVGQWFIPEANVAGRRSAFWLLAIYVASGMGLLLTTSFLGLRRYLRQRHIEMPGTMAGLWLGVGSVIIVLLLVFAMLLPRPSAEYAVSQLPFTIGSPDQKSSRMTPVEQEGTPDEQPGGAPEPVAQDIQKRERSESDALRNQAVQPKPESIEGRSKGEPDSHEPPNSGGTASTKSNSKSSQAGSPSKSGGSSSGGKGKSQSSKSNAKGGKSSQSKKQSQNKSQAADKTNDRQQSTEQKQQPADQQQPDNQQQPADAEQQPAESSPDEQQTEQAAQERSASESAPQASRMPDLQPPAALETITGGLAELLKWAFYAVVALGALYLFWRFRAEVLRAIADFVAAIRDFLSGFWGGTRAPTAASQADAAAIEFPPAPFASFADPFATGIATRYSLEELIRYSFEAFEAWAREHGCPRRPDQTPHELARDVSRVHKPMAEDARNLAELYSEAAYADSDLPASSAQQLEHLWQRMRAGVAAS